eukprot:12578517-Alexandrium_andersonii.AAC.1
MPDGPPADGAPLPQGVPDAVAALGAFARLRQIAPLLRLLTDPGRLTFAFDGARRRGSLRCARRAGG